MKCIDCGGKDMKTCKCGWEERPLTTKETILFNLKTIKIVLKTNNPNREQIEGALEALELIKENVLKEGDKKRKNTQARPKDSQEK